MRNIFTVMKRELSGYFSTPVAYVIIIIFLLLSMSFAFWLGRILDAGDSSLWTFFNFLPWFFVVLAPAIGMKLWSEEHRLGTVELLMTLPVTAWQCIVGKFLASALLWLLCLALTFPIVCTIFYLGDPDRGHIAGGYLGAFFYSLCCLAITMAVSAFTRSQVVCLIVSVVICLALTLIGYPPLVEQLKTVLDPSLIDGLAAFSLTDHYYSMAKGVIAIPNLIFFLSVIVVSLIITSIAIRVRRA